MRRLLAIVFALLVTACRDDVRDIRLTAVDLTNVAALRELGDRLSPAERAALLTYAAIHAPSSPAFCGSRLENRWGEEPQTIGDAIELTLSIAAQSGNRAAKKPAEVRTS